MNIAIKEERLLKLFKDLVFINSPSTKEQLLADKIVDLLKELPVEIFTVASIKKDKPNILIRLSAKDWSENNPILLSAHMDTIEPTDSLVWIQEGDTIKTDGSTILGADDKTGIAIILEVLFDIIENDLPHPEIEILFSTEEEIHLLGSKALDLSLLHSKRGIVLDSDGETGLITHIAPSHYSFEATITGIPAHAGMQPEKGKSAILFASQVISKMPFGRIDFETTSNIGIIQGGKATNIVAETCKLNGEVRSLSDGKLSVVSEYIEKLFLDGKSQGFQIDYRGGRIYNAYQINKNSNFLQDLWNAGKEVGIEPKFVSSGGGSDANIFNEKIPSMTCVVLSCGMANPHTHREQASILTINKTALWLLYFLTKK